MKWLHVLYPANGGPLVQTEKSEIQVSVTKITPQSHIGKMTGVNWGAHVEDLY